MSDTTPSVPIGRKLPEHALWEVLQRRAQPLALEFCRYFFAPNREPSYPQAKKWLEEYGIKMSVKSLNNFYRSLDVRLKYASLEAEISSEQSLPADIEKATQDRMKQIMFELAYMPMAENQRLQLIALQQNADGMKGNFAIKKQQVDLKRIEVLMKSDAFIGRMLEKAAELLADTKTSQSDRIKLMRQEMFKDVEQFWATEKIELPGAKDQASKPQAPEKSQPPT